MSDHSIHTNRLKPLTIIKMCITCFLICGFVYGCNSAKGKKNKKSENVMAHQRNNTQTKQGSKQTDPQSPTEKKRKISKNWKTFFSGETKAQVRIHLLQHGPQFTKALKNFSQSKMAQRASATITGIKLNNDTTATVSYIINIGGAPVLKNRTGKSFYLDGIWKVSDGAFCSLLGLSGHVPEPCPDSNDGSS